MSTIADAITPPINLKAVVFSCDNYIGLEKTMEQKAEHKEKLNPQYDPGYQNLCYYWFRWSILP